MYDGPVARCREQVGRLVDAALGAARDADDLAALVSGIDGIVAREIRLAAASGAPRPACGPGCASCCTIHVATLPLEGAAAAGFLGRALAAGERAARAAELRAFHDDVRWLEDHERARCGFRCPLLDARAACAIHSVRPLACRSVSSADAAACRRAMAEADEDGAVVPMRLVQKALYDEALSAAGEGLHRHGLDARRRDVSGMTAVFLADAGLVRRWLAGAPVPIE